MDELLAELIATLDGEGIIFAHWKGNARLEHILASGDDLDVLVPDPGHARALAVLRSLGFRVAVPRLEPTSDATTHHYGFGGGDRLLHVHLYRQVVMGENFVDSHALPLERMLTEGTSRHLGIPIPRRAAECVVYVLKSYIRYGSLLDLVANAISTRDEEAERSWLDLQGHLEESISLLKEHLPVVEASLYSECVDGLVRGCSAGRKLRLSAAIRARLGRYRRQGWMERVWAKAGFLTRKGSARIGFSTRGKRLEGRGRTVGLAGSSEEVSEVAAELERWLSQTLAVRTVDLWPFPSTGSTSFPRIRALTERFVIASALHSLRTGEIIFLCGPGLEHQDGQGQLAVGAEPMDRAGPVEIDRQDLTGPWPRLPGALRPDRTFLVTPTRPAGPGRDMKRLKDAVWEVL